MRIKIVFEIGHTAQQKNKASPEGFTHDWELFVRGADGMNISRFVDRIVFNLHESFPKPCRGKIGQRFSTLCGQFASNFVVVVTCGYYVVHCYHFMLILLH